MCSLGSRAKTAHVKVWTDLPDTYVNADRLRHGFGCRTIAQRATKSEKSAREPACVSEACNWMLSKHWPVQSWHVPPTPWRRRAAQELPLYVTSGDIRLLLDSQYFRYRAAFGDWTSSKRGGAATAAPTVHERPPAGVSFFIPALPKFWHNSPTPS